MEPIFNAAMGAAGLPTSRSVGSPFTITFSASTDTEPQFNLVEPRGAFGRVHETNPVAVIGQEGGASGARTQDAAASLLPQIPLEVAQNRVDPWWVLRLSYCPVARSARCTRSAAKAPALEGRMNPSPYENKVSWGRTISCSRKATCSDLSGSRSSSGNDLSRCPPADLRDTPRDAEEEYLHHRPALYTAYSRRCRCPHTGSRPREARECARSPSRTRRARSGLPRSGEGVRPADRGGISISGTGIPDPTLRTRCPWLTSVDAAWLPRRWPRSAPIH